MRIGLIIGSLACLAASAVAAQSAIGISRSVYVERIARTAAGERVRAIEPATILRRGDKVILVVQWDGADPRRPVTVSSAIPRTLAFQRSSDDGVEVSADGGGTWGRIGTLRVADDGGSRLAAPEDITHLRWRVAERRDPDGEGRVTYSAIVR